MVRISTVKKPCPHCKGKVIRQGYYYTKAKPHKRQRYYCKSCGRSLVFRRRKYFRRKWDNRIIREVDSLAGRQKLIPNKYDPLKQTTYSTREISRIVSKNSDAK